MAKLKTNIRRWFGQSEIAVVSVNDEAARLNLSYQFAKNKIVTQDDTGVQWVLNEGGRPSDASNWSRVRTPENIYKAESVAFSLSATGPYAPNELTVDWTDIEGVNRVETVVGDGKSSTVGVFLSNPKIINSMVGVTNNEYKVSAVIAKSGQSIDDADLIVMEHGSFPNTKSFIFSGSVSSDVLLSKEGKNVYEIYATQSPWENVMSPVDFLTVDYVDEFGTYRRVTIPPPEITNTPGQIIDFSLVLQSPQSIDVISNPQLESYSIMARLNPADSTNNYEIESGTSNKTTKTEMLDTVEKTVLWSLTKK